MPHGSQWAVVCTHFPDLVRVLTWGMHKSCPAALLLSLLLPEAPPVRCMAFRWAPEPQKAVGEPRVLEKTPTVETLVVNYR
jgi:hypothetical protein